MNFLSPFSKSEESSDNTTREVSVFQDPFQQNCIDEISISYRKPIFSTNHVWSGRVDFKSGLTTGQQKTPECNTWDELMIHMKQIYDSLNVKPS